VINTAAAEMVSLLTTTFLHKRVAIRRAASAESSHEGNLCP
jgi:hypothetical protein